jgi:hypothetical protein
VTGFIDHVYTLLGTTRNYSAVANIQTSQVTSTRLVFSVFARLFLVTALTVDILQLPTLKSSSHSRPCRILVNCQLDCSTIPSQPPLQSLILDANPQLTWLLQFSSSQQLCTDRIENIVPNNSHVIVDECLLIRYLETCCITSLFIVTCVYVARVT